MRTTVRGLTGVLALPLLALLSCTAPAAAPTAAIPDVDRKVDPCADFDAFANGPWRAANPIPEQLSRWGRQCWDVAGVAIPIMVNWSRGAC